MVFLVARKAVFTLWRKRQFWALKMPLPYAHLYLVPQYPFVTSTFDDTKLQVGTLNSKFHLIRSFFEIFATFLSFHV